MFHKLMRRCSLIVLLMLLGLTACGGPPATPNANTAPTDAASVAATPEADAAPAVEATAPAEAVTEAPAVAPEATAAAPEATAAAPEATDGAIEATAAATAEASVDDSLSTAVTPEAGSEAAGTVGEPLTVGMVLVGPINDRGWNQAHYEAMTRIAGEVPGVKFIYVDKVNPADRPNVQVQQVVDDLVSQGAMLIITNSDDFKDGTREAAETHPDVTFLHMSGDDVLTGQAPPNLGNIMGQMEYGKMIGGCAAALQSQSGQIAYLGPLINDETRRLVNATFLGARHCWTNVRNMPAADLKLKVTWIGFWFNIPGVTLDPSQVVNDFISSGHDVVISGIDTAEAVVETNKARQGGKEVWSVAYDYREGCDVGPAVCLGVPYFNWYPAYKNTIEAVQAGTWKPEWLWLAPNWQDLNNPDTSNVGFMPGPALSEANKSQLDAFIAGLGDGTVNLWQGPLNFQDGTAFLKEGETATDKQIWYMPQLLEGIEGQSAPQ